MAEVVRQVAERYRFGQRQVGLAWYPEGHQVHFGEGDFYEFIYADECVGVEMVTQNTVGAAGVSYEIGAQSPPLPAGTWFVHVHYYTKYWMTIGNVVPKRIEA